MTFQPSKYQQAIYDFVQNADGNGVVNGVAGCGKTTTNIEAQKLTNPLLSTKFLAFGNRIAKEMRDRGVDASTLHSLGMQCIKGNKSRAKMNQYKNYDIYDKLFSDGDYDLKNIISQLIGRLKGNMVLDPEMPDIYWLIDNVTNINIEWSDRDMIASRTLKVYQKGLKDHTQFDFDDMIFWPASSFGPTVEYDFLFVDEAQDLNKAQIVLAERLLSADGRMLLIGDPFQSIFAFRGAFNGVMSYMANRLEATELPLTVSYRAPQAVVDLVNDKYPHIAFEPGPDPQPGLIRNISEDQFLEEVKPGDGAICRTNAPLIGPCFALIRQGIKATVLGRDIGKGLSSLVRRRAKLKRCHSVKDLIQELNIYLDNERPKLEEVGNRGRLSTLEDQISTIVAISDGCDTIKAIQDKIKVTFSDEKAAITFSSIHKAKGLEYDTVHVIAPYLSPHPMAQSQEEKEQEVNLEYVRDTRTKDVLNLVY